MASRIGMFPAHVDGHCSSQLEVEHNRDRGEVTAPGEWLGLLHTAQL